MSDDKSTGACVRRVKVTHEWYGCDTGCCGAIVRDADTDEELLPFEFMHYDDDTMIAVKLGQAVVVVSREKCP